MVKFSKQPLVSLGLFRATRGLKVESVTHEEERNQKTFDFLRFTHYCSECRNGRFRVKRKTSKKKFANSLKKFK